MSVSLAAAGGALLVFHPSEKTYVLAAVMQVPLLGILSWDLPDFSGDA